MYIETRSGLLNYNRSTNGASGMLPFGGVGKSGNQRAAEIDAVRYSTFDGDSRKRMRRCANTEPLGKTFCQSCITFKADAQKGMARREQNVFLSGMVLRLTMQWAVVFISTSILFRVFLWMDRFLRARTGSLRASLKRIIKAFSLKYHKVVTSILLQSG